MVTLHRVCFKGLGVYLASSPRRSKGMGGQRWISLSPQGILSVPNAQRHVHPAVLGFLLLFYSIGDVLVPKRTEQVQGMWSSVISCGSITLRIAIDQLP